MGTQVTLRKVTSKKKKKKIYIQYGGGHYDVLLRVLCTVVCAIGLCVVVWGMQGGLCYGSQKECKYILFSFSNF